MRTSFVQLPSEDSHLMVAQCQHNLRRSKSAHFSDDLESQHGANEAEDKPSWCSSDRRCAHHASTHVNWITLQIPSGSGWKFFRMLDASRVSEHSTSRSSLSCISGGNGHAAPPPVFATCTDDLQTGTLDHQSYAVPLRLIASFDALGCHPYSSKTGTHPHRCHLSLRSWRSILAAAACAALLLVAAVASCTVWDVRHGSDSHLARHFGKPAARTMTWCGSYREPAAFEICCPVSNLLTNIILPEMHAARFGGHRHPLTQQRHFRVVIQAAACRACCSSPRRHAVHAASNSMLIHSARLDPYYHGRVEALDPMPRCCQGLGCLLADGRTSRNAVVTMLRTDQYLGLTQAGFGPH